MHFEIYQEQPSLRSLNLPHPDFRWRLVTNGNIIADSGEGYRNKADCQHGIDLVKGTSAVTGVIDQTMSGGLLNPAAAALPGLDPRFRGFKK